MTSDVERKAPATMERDKAARTHGHQLTLHDSLLLTVGIHAFSQHKGFEEDFLADGVTPTSCVSVSITEVSTEDTNAVPIQGAASCRVDNVVPEAGRLRVRGEIGWNRDLPCRLYWHALTIKQDPEKK
ncbi:MULTISPECIES: hypothetical protein [unclassified Streptomyces]|uniref:hypothetical protein n=1 Tax=unclassified Streptomyces TaxID=2593676 RepID=UPI0036FE36E9